MKTYSTKSPTVSEQIGWKGKDDTILPMDTDPSDPRALIHPKRGGLVAAKQRYGSSKPLTFEAPDIDATGKALDDAVAEAVEILGGKKAQIQAAIEKQQAKAHKAKVVALEKLAGIDKANSPTDIKLLDA